MPPTTPEESSGTRWGLQAWRLFGLSGLAVGQPLLGTLSGAGSFFIAHTAGIPHVVALVLVVLLVPPLVIFALVRVAGAIGPRIGRVAMAVCVGGLAALAVVAPMDNAEPLRLRYYAALVVVVGAAAGVAFVRSQTVRTFTTVLGVAPLLVAGVFLLSPAVQGTIRDAAVSTELSSGDQSADVVVLVLDELPLGALLEPGGDIDASRFPGFARLASLSTWYPNATTVAPETTAAVPSLLTGRFPRHPTDEELAPTAAEYPRNLFTMLAGTHTMQVHEWVTQLCPRALCAPAAGIDAGSWRSFATDVWILAQHEVLPNRLGARVLPPVSGRWAGFSGGEDADEEDRGRTAGRQLERATEDLGTGPSPRLSFIHERLPHRPMNKLPDGTTYARSTPFDWYGNQRAWGVLPYRQQFLLQVGYVDRLIDRFLDRLADGGQLESSLVIVVSDHGLNLQPVGHPRAMDTTDLSSLSDVVPVPLFVKYPGQSTPEVDDRRVQTVDVLPTVADVLGVELDEQWDLDGTSLTSVRAGRGPWYWQPVGEVDRGWLEMLDPTTMVIQHRELFGVGGGIHDLFAMGPHRDLIGQETPKTVERANGVVVSPVDPNAFDAVDRSSGAAPVLVEAIVEGLSPGAWVAVGLNGYVAGLGPVLEPRDIGHRVEILVDPTFLRDGSNELAVYVVEGAAPGELKRVELP